MSSKRGTKSNMHCVLDATIDNESITVSAQEYTVSYAAYL